MRSFKLPEGYLLSPRYKVVERLGGGSEGEVYKIREKATGLTRAAKIFFSTNSKLSKRIVRYARKLERLRDCDIVIKYLHTERIKFNDKLYHCLISEYFGGVVLDALVRNSPGRRRSGRTSTPRHRKLLWCQRFLSWKCARSPARPSTRSAHDGTSTCIVPSSAGTGEHRRLTANPDRSNPVSTAEL